MNKIKILSAIAGLFAAGMLSAATPDIKYFQPRELIQVSTDDVQISFDQTEASVFVTAKSPYELYCRSKWLTASEKDGQILISAQQNDSFVPRTARIILTTKDMTSFLRCLPQATL